MSLFAEVWGHDMATGRGRIGLYSVVFVMYHTLIQTTWRNGIYATYNKQMTTDENAHATMEFVVCCCHCPWSVFVLLF